MTMATELVADQAILGEGPVWSERDQAVYWVDIFAKRILRHDVHDATLTTWSFAEQVTSLAEAQRGGFVASTRDGFSFLDLETASLTSIADVEGHLADNRFNDGKTDPQGRFWAGTMSTNEADATGSLYCLKPDLTVAKMDDGYTITNGPAFSLDGQTMFHTDSAQRTVFAFDLAIDGVITNKRPFIRFEDPSWGGPDGMTVDSEGCLWVCHFGGFRITRFSPAGEAIATVELPVPNVTSCTFGGPSLDTLYITTARLHMDNDALEAHPSAGSLFTCTPGPTGLPTPVFGSP